MVYSVCGVSLWAILNLKHMGLVIISVLIVEEIIISMLFPKDGVSYETRGSAEYLTKREDK